TFSVVWRANAVRVTVLEGIRCARRGKRSLRLWGRMGAGRTTRESPLTSSTLCRKVQHLLRTRMGLSPFTQAAAGNIAPPAAREARPIARRILLDAVVLGGLADALLRQGFGFSFLVWMLACAVTFVHFARWRRDGLTREQAAWLGAALFFTSAFAWR